jgi:hypothetical protein
LLSPPSEIAIWTVKVVLVGVLVHTSVPSGRNSVIVVATGPEMRK